MCKMQASLMSDHSGQGCSTTGQFPVNLPGKATKDYPCIWTLATCVRDLDGVAGFNLVQSLSLQLLEGINQWVDINSYSLILFIFFLHISNKRILRGGNSKKQISDTEISEERIGPQGQLLHKVKPL